MAKTLKKILELYKPKAGDEQKFVAKHVVAKTDDVNKNGDDVFQGTNVKKVDRKKERHGYEAGEDAKMYEEVDLEELTLEELDAFMMSEEFEELDEISKDLAKRYRAHALSDIAKRSATADNTSQQASHDRRRAKEYRTATFMASKPDAKKKVRFYNKVAKSKEDEVKSAVSKIGKRVQGIQRATVRAEEFKINEGYGEQDSEYRKEAIKHAERVLAAVKNEKLNGCKYISRNLQDMADDMENSIEMAEKYAMKEDVDVSDQSVKLLELYANLNDDNKENMIEMFDTSKDVLLSFINQEESEQDNG